MMKTHKIFQILLQKVNKRLELKDFQISEWRKKNKQVKFKDGVNKNMRHDEKFTQHIIR